jgi:hypothetical protein
VKEQLVKSKDRVAQHGEVFTAEREVNAMLDLVKDETMRIESRFLEPACGEGNFLVEILRRKLNVVENRYKKSQTDYEKYSILALSSIYGVELLEDNASICREILFDIWKDSYAKNCKGECSGNFLKSAKFILERNICCGDALTMKTNDHKPIIFSQWDLAMGDMMKRIDYRLDVLLETEEDNSKDHYQISFDDIGVEWEYQNGTYVKIPKPLMEYPLIEYWRVFEYE